MESDILWHRRVIPHPGRTVDSIALGEDLFFFKYCCRFMIRWLLAWEVQAAHHDGFDRVHRPERNSEISESACHPLA